jgi:7-cyano-7-deazaguanine reductase
MTEPKPRDAATALAQDADIVKARLERQSRIETRRNPLPRVDYLCKVEGVVTSDGASVELRYVPDKLLLQMEAFGVYLAALPEPPSLESLAATLIDDLNNELVPRFLQVRVTSASDDLDRGHAVLMEDRRPRWDNPALLARLPRF